MNTWAEIGVIPKNAKDCCAEVEEAGMDSFLDPS